MPEQTELRQELREQMGDWVMGYVHRRRRRRRALTVAGVGVGVAAIVVGASAWVVLAPQSVVERHVTCYAQASTSSNEIEGVLSGANAIGDPAANALDLCGGLWQLGTLDQSGSAPHGADGQQHPVPDLQLCTRTDGTYTVFPVKSPGDSVASCDALGLVPVPGH